MPNSKAIPWHERPVRMMRLDYVDRLARVRYEDLDALARSKREDWHINCEWVIGTPGIAPGLGHLTTFNTPKFEKYAPLGDFDLVRAYLPHARNHGIRVLAYLNMHWFSYDFAAEHPDWEQITASGEPYGRVHPLYGGGTTLCVNSPWRQWACDMVAEAMRTGIDGVFLDGPVVFPGCCHCESCRNLFHERTGSPIPPEEDWGSELWKDFVEFREESMAAFLADCRSAAREVNPDAVVFLNAGSWHAGAWRVARDIEKVGPHQDFNGAEAFLHPGQGDRPLFFWATAAKHLMAGNKPSVVFSHHALGAWHYIPLPPVETALAIAQTAACGANPWFAVFDYALDHSRDLAVRGVRDVSAFIEDNEEFFTDSRSTAKVALLYSRQTATYYISELAEMYAGQGAVEERDLIASTRSGPAPEDLRRRKETCDGICGNSYLGWFNALTRQHIPFDVLLDSGVTDEGLADYDVLIIGNAACLSGEQARAIRRFVQSGRGLIGEFEAGCYDERGRSRGTSPLAELFGVASLNGAMPPAYGEEYIRVAGAHAVTDGFAAGQLIARPPYSLKVTAAPGAETPAVYLEPTGRLYAAPKGESCHPALIAGESAAGRTVFFPSLTAEFYARYKMQEHELLMSSAVRWACRQQFPVTIEAPPTVQMEVRAQSDPPRLLIHLVNNTGDMQRPMYHSIPVHGLRMRVEKAGIRSVRSLRGAAGLRADISKNGADILLPRLDLYDILVVELLESTP
mgnify:CR=1 FL=1|jgi:hypothetical protein